MSGLLDTLGSAVGTVGSVVGGALVAGTVGSAFPTQAHSSSTQASSSEQHPIVLAPRQPFHQAEVETTRCADVGPALSTEEQIRSDEELARRLSSCDGSSLDYLRQLSSSPQATSAPMPTQPTRTAPQPSERGGSAFGAPPPPPPFAISMRPMLLVGAVLGGFGIELLVDTGAQSSILSAPLMSRLGLGAALDRSMQGVAQGVGSARIVGRCRDVPLVLGHVEFLIDMTILDVESDLAMLGLDQLRRFKCIVDLEREVLVFGGSGGVEVPFLPDDRARAYSQRVSQSDLASLGGCGVM